MSDVELVWIIIISYQCYYCLFSGVAVFDWVSSVVVIIIFAGVFFLFVCVVISVVNVTICHSRGLHI